MTVEELGDVLDLKPSYIKSHWTRIVENQKKKNIYLYKIGRGENTNYGIQMPWETEPVWNTDSLEMY